MTAETLRSSASERPHARYALHCPTTHDSHMSNVLSSLLCGSYHCSTLSYGFAPAGFVTAAAAAERRQRRRRRRRGAGSAARGMAAQPPRVRSVLLGRGAYLRRRFEPSCICSTDSIGPVARSTCPGSRATRPPYQSAATECAILIRRLSSDHISVSSY